MDDQDHGDSNTGKVDNHPFSIGESASSIPSEKPANPTIPAVFERDVNSDFDKRQSDNHLDAEEKPLQVVITRCEELGLFERKTILYAKIAAWTSILSLAAALSVGVLFILQFDQMRKQTAILDKSFRKQQDDSKASAESTAAQLKILQGQLKQQSDAMQLDQRAWVGFSGFSEIYKAATQGQHSAGSVIINTGKTPTRSVNAIVFINERTASVYPNPADVSWMNNLITRSEDKGDRGSGGKLVDRIPHPKGFISLSGPVRLSIGTIATGEPQPLISIGRFAGETKKDNSDLYPRNVVVIFGKIEYWDVFGHPRKTIFCSQRSASPEQPFGRCPIYNDME
jgi:hypothetical protein